MPATPYELQGSARNVGLPATGGGAYAQALGTGDSPTFVAVSGDGSGLTNVPAGPAPTLADVLTAGNDAEAQDISGVANLYALSGIVGAQQLLSEDRTDQQPTALIQSYAGRCYWQINADLNNNPFRPDLNQWSLAIGDDGVIDTFSVNRNTFGTLPLFLIDGPTLTTTFASGNVSIDGTGGVHFAQLATADLPDPTLNAGTTYYNTDTGLLTTSNGTSWV